MTEAAPRYHPVCRLRDLREGRAVAGVVEGRGVAVFLSGGVPRAVSDRCPHNGMPLADSGCRDGVVTCRWHGWSFDLESGQPPGAAVSGPRLRVFPVRVRDGWVEVTLETAPDAGAEGAETAES